MKKVTGFLCAAAVAANVVSALAADNCCRKTVYTTQRQPVPCLPVAAAGSCRFPMSYSAALKRAEDATKAEAEAKHLTALLATARQELAAEKQARTEAEAVATGAREDAAKQRAIATSSQKAARDSQAAASAARKKAVAAAAAEDDEQGAGRRRYGEDHHRGAGHHVRRPFGRACLFGQAVPRGQLIQPPAGSRWVRPGVPNI